MLDSLPVHIDIVRGGMLALAMWAFIVMFLLDHMIWKMHGIRLKKEYSDGAKNKKGSSGDNDSKRSGLKISNESAGKTVSVTKLNPREGVARP